MMPAELKMQLVQTLNAIDRGEQDWALPNLQGHITSVEKTSLSQTTSDFRPITVLSMLYRCWASIRARQLLSWIDQWADSGITGNRPGWSTKSVWWQVAAKIEAAYHNGECLSGAITDICKCFNTLPRPIVYALGRHLTIPSAFMTSWHQAVHNLERRFVIHGQTSAAIHGVTGYPEGDPLSVVSMTLINVYMHAFLDANCRPSQVISYVDNWEGTSSSATMVAEMIRQFDQFATSIDIKVDHRKTVGWSTATEGRKTIKQDGIKVEYACRDLGGHLALCRRRTIFTVHNRIASNHPTWTWLKRSVAPVEQKLKVLHTVCWPRCLHGIESVTLAEEHFVRLRTMAVQALGWNKKGANPMIQLGLIVDPGHDPQFYAIQTTILTMRQQGQAGEVGALLDHIAWTNPAKHIPGPCGIFLERLHSIGWQWTGSGLITDHEGMPLSLFDDPIQLLRSRMRHAWHTRVTSLLTSPSRRKPRWGYANSHGWYFLHT